jgi:hypothetical protein
VDQTILREMTPARVKALAISDWLTIAMALQPHIIARLREPLNKLILENLRKYFEYATEAKLEEIDKWRSAADDMSTADVARLRRLQRDVLAKIGLYPDE